MEKKLVMYRVLPGPVSPMRIQVSYELTTADITIRVDVMIEWRNTGLLVSGDVEYPPSVGLSGKLRQELIVNAIDAAKKWQDIPEGANYANGF